MLNRHPLNSPELSLYIHVPFCRRKCDYCAFYSVLPGPEERDRYLDRRIEELRRFRELYGYYRVKTVYIGGGTPSVLGPRRLARLFRGLADALPGSPGLEECSLELNPEDVSRELLDSLRDSPVTRLSLGVQSLNETTLRTIGRRGAAGAAGAAEAARSALETLRGGWPGVLSADLIAGVPGRSPKEAREDVQSLAAAGVDHLSIYALTLEPGTALYRRLRPRDGATGGWLAALEEAQARGYRRYEVSNLARPGAECRHNQRFWEGRPYIGLGPAAVSTVWNSRVDTSPGALRWTRGHREGEITGEERLGYSELLLEYLMLRLRTREGLDLQDFAGIFGCSARGELEAAAGRVLAEGLLRREDGAMRLRASDRGYRYLDGVLRELSGGLSLTEACPDDSVKRSPVE